MPEYSAKDLSPKDYPFYVFLRRELFNSVVGDFGDTPSGSLLLREMNNTICKIIVEKHDW